MCICLSVCLSAFYRPHDICPLCGAASEWPRAGAVAGGPARAGKHALARARAHMPYNFSTKKSLRWCLSKTKPCARAHAVVYVTAEIFKKREKENQHATPKFSLQFAFSWSVYFSNRTESYLIFGRSRPWSARIHRVAENYNSHMHTRWRTTHKRTQLLSSDLQAWCLGLL